MASVTLWLCWYVVSSMVSTTPFLFQITVVGGPPVDVQVSVLVSSFSEMLRMCGEPNQIIKECFFYYIQAKAYHLLQHRFQ